MRAPGRSKKGVKNHQKMGEKIEWKILIKMLKKYVKKMCKNLQLIVKNYWKFYLFIIKIM